MTEERAPYTVNESEPIHETCPICGAPDSHKFINSQHFTCGGWMIRETWFAICPKAPEIIAGLRAQVAGMKEDAAVGKAIRAIPECGGMIITHYDTTGSQFEVYLSTKVVIIKGRGDTPADALRAAGLMKEEEEDPMDEVLEDDGYDAHTDIRGWEEK